MAKQPKQRWTDHQYEEWLQDVLAIFTQYVDENRAWPKGAKRFGYLYSEVTAPAYRKLDQKGSELMLAFEHPRDSARRISLAKESQKTASVGPPSTLEQLEAPYRTAHEVENPENPEAIFEWARDSYEALMAPWVARQLVEWRLEGTPQAKRKFDRFVRAYWSERGKRTGRTTLDIIRRDQEIYRASLHRGRKISREDWIAGQAEAHRVSVETVKDVLKHYSRHHRQWTAGELWPFPRLPRRHIPHD